MRRWWIIGILFLSAVCFTCSNKGNSSNNNNNDGDDTNPPGPEIDIGTPVVIDETNTASSKVAVASIGLSVTPDKQWAVAYYRNGVVNETGCTTPITGGGSTSEMQDEVWYASFDGTNWNSELVDTIHSVFLGSISLVYNNTNQAFIAYLGGPDGNRCCGGSKLIQANRVSSNNWVSNQVVTSSHDALAGNNCPAMQTICDVGDLVGLWPYQAVSPDGTIIGIVYQDAHFCYGMSDVIKADAELYTSGGSTPQHEWIDPGRGGGNYNRLVYDASNVPAVVFYNVNSPGSIYFSKRGAGQWPWDYCDNSTPCQTGYTCYQNRCGMEVVKNVGSLPEGSLSLIVDSQGRYLLAYFDTNNNILKIAHSADGVTWKSGTIDSNGSTGMYPSIMMNPATNKPVIVYYRCGETTDGLDCNYNRDGVRLAVFVGTYPDELTTKSKWRRYDDTYFPLDKDGSDGKFVSAAIQSDGTIGLAYMYSWYDQISQSGKNKLMFRTIKLKSN
jgi:hypothetical protein